jgi:hypothetical protein
MRRILIGLLGLSSFCISVHLPVLAQTHKQKADIEVVGMPGRSLFYIYKGQRIALTERQDAIAVEFKPVGGTRGQAQPLYLRLQQALQSGTRSADSGIEVSPLGESYAIVTTPASRDGNNRVERQVQQQPYVQETLPVLTRSDRNETVVLPNQIILSFQPGLSESQQRKILQQNNLEVIRPLRFSRDRYLVRATAVSGIEVLTVANQLNQVRGVRSVSPDFIQSLSDPQRQRTTNESDPSPNLQSFNQWTKQPPTGNRAISPESPLLGLQWHLYSPPLKQCLQASAASLTNCLSNVDKTTSLPRTDLRVREAWQRSTGGKGVVVAVLDSLIQWDHPNLQPSLYTVTAANKCPGEQHGWDFTVTAPSRTTDPCKIGDADTRISRMELAPLAPTFRQTFQLSDAQLLRQYPGLVRRFLRQRPGLSRERLATRIRNFLRMEVAAEFHGTWVSGVVAAQPEPGGGVVGVAPNAKILPVRVMGLNGQFVPSSYLEGLAYAADRNADIINISLGGRLPNQDEAELIADLLEKYPNLVIVAAAGNENKTKVAFPAGFPGIVAVGATNLLGNRAAYSNFGQGLTLVAPGGELSSSWAGGIPTTGGTWLAEFWQGIPAPQKPWSHVLDPKGEYWWVEGTSFSSPAVAGVVALMKGEDPQRRLNRDRLLTILKSTSTYDGLTISKEEEQQYRLLLQKRQIPTSMTAQQFFFGSGLVNADAALREVKRSP